MFAMRIVGGLCRISAHRRKFQTRFDGEDREFGTRPGRPKKHTILLSEIEGFRRQSYYPPRP